MKHSCQKSEVRTRVGEGAIPSPIAKIMVIKMRKFKYAPKGIPPLTEEQWKELTRPLTKQEKEKQKKIFEEARKVYEHFLKGQLFKYHGQIIETDDGKKWIYDNKHQEWIDVTPPKNFKRKFVPLR